MTDPLDTLFTTLRDPAGPVEPDPAFARALRARLERALLAPLEDPMPATTLARPTPAATTHTVTAYLCVTDARAAVAFYVDAFGAARRDEPVVMPDGRIGHVEVALGDSVLMLAEEFPEIGLLAPATRGGASQSLRLEVADPDDVVERAVAAGAVLERPVADSAHGRGGVVLDASGHRWMVDRAPAEARTGDVVYASVWAADPERAARFLRAVLGRDVPVAGHPTHRGLFLCVEVPDVDAAAEVVRAAGGTADAPHERPHGRVVDCVDDQGLPFALHTGRGAPVTDPVFAEIRTPDAGRARAFYGTVLGWGFAPGHAPGTWNGLVGGGRTRPRTGLSGGHDGALVVPTFDVADLGAALAAVRAAGGTAAEPTERPFGLVADCADDQGTPLRLRQGRP